MADRDSFEQSPYELPPGSTEVVLVRHGASEAAVVGSKFPLVDGHSRVGQTGLVFYDTLFDENASSHIALGASIVQAVPGASEQSAEERHERGVNHSSIHTDFMIGSDELEIDGAPADGEAVPIMRNGDWLL